MYNELDTYITEFSDENSSDDYWYDVGVIHASQLLDNFSKDDWNELKEHIAKKNNMWKKRFVYCLGDHNSDEDIEIILKLMDTDDEELFVMCVDALNELLHEKDKVRMLSRINIDFALKIMSKSDVVTRNIIKRFIQK